MKPVRTDRIPTSALLLAAALAATPGTAGAQTGADREDASSGREGATFLLVPLGARNVGLGGAFAGADADVEGSIWNPASLAGVGTWAVHYHGANDFGTSTHALGGVVRLGEFRAALSLMSVDLGTIDARDEANRPIGTIEPSNMLAVLTIARPVSTAFDVGASYKFVRQGGGCTGCEGLEPDATGHAFDLAVGVRPPGIERLRLGLVASNLGGGIAYGGDGPSDPLPGRIRLGGELLVIDAAAPAPEMAPGDVELRVRADLRQTFTEFDDLDLYAGAEIGYRSIAYLRAGYAAAGAGRTGPALGIGLRYRGFHLDVGRSFDDFAGFGEDAPFQVSVAYQP